MLTLAGVGAVSRDEDDRLLVLAAGPGRRGEAVSSVSSVDVSSIDVSGSAKNRQTVYNILYVHTISPVSPTADYRPPPCLSIYKGFIIHKTSRWPAGLAG